MKAQKTEFQHLALGAFFRYPNGRQLYKKIGEMTYLDWRGTICYVKTIRWNVVEVKKPFKSK